MKKILLIIFMLTTAASLRAQQYYFPLKRQADYSGLDSANIKKFSVPLNLTGEPVLYSDRHDGHIFRLTFLKPGDQYLVLRFQDYPHGDWLYWKKYDGKTHTLTASGSKQVDGKTFHSFVRGMNKINTCKPDTTAQLAPDGWEWTFERKTGYYVVVDRSSPGADIVYHTCCERLLELAGLKE